MTDALLVNVSTARFASPDRKYRLGLFSCMNVDRAKTISQFHLTRAGKPSLRSPLLRPSAWRSDIAQLIICKSSPFFTDSQAQKLAQNWPVFARLPYSNIYDIIGIR